MKLCIVLQSAAALLVCAGPHFAQLPAETEFRVKLMSPISTETNRKGDRVNAQVVSPEQYRGDVLEGAIRESKSGAKIKGKAVLNFSFDTLQHAGQAVPVHASIKSMINSRGQQNVDEEGRVIQKKNSLGKAAIGAGAGALIGALVGGAKGAAIGAGAGAAAALVLIEVGTEGANVAFAPGSEFILAVKQR
jgi:hypothetical protein